MLSLAHVTLMTFINFLPASPLCTLRSLSLTASFLCFLPSFPLHFFPYLFNVHKLSTLGTILSLEGLGDMKIKILKELMGDYNTLCYTLKYTITYVWYEKRPEEGVALSKGGGLWAGVGTGRNCQMYGGVGLFCQGWQHIPKKAAGIGKQCSANISLHCLCDVTVIFLPCYHPFSSQIPRPLLSLSSLLLPCIP